MIVVTSRRKTVDSRVSASLMNRKSVVKRWVRAAGLSRETWARSASIRWPNRADCMSASMRVTTRLVSTVSASREKPLTEVTTITKRGASRIACRSLAVKASKAALMSTG
jgi:hypothetical protein